MTESRKAAIASRFRLAREQAGLSQGQAARLLGWHRPSISSLEAGKRSVATEELPLFADLYGVSGAWLACEEAPGQSQRETEIMLAARGLSSVSQDELDSLVQLLTTLRADK